MSIACGLTRRRPWDNSCRTVTGRGAPSPVAISASRLPRHDWRFALRDAPSSRKGTSPDITLVFPTCQSPPRDVSTNPFRARAQDAVCTAPRCNRRPLMINVNKLFPRLSIRVKLAIAFALVALGPLAVVSFIGARETVFQIEAMARNTLEHDLEMAETETALSLGSEENHMNLIGDVVLGPLLHDGPITARERLDAERVVKTLLATEPTLYQVKLIDADGRYRMLIRATGPSLNAEKMDGGEYYAWRASSMPPHTRLLFAIEVAGPEERGH